MGISIGGQVLSYYDVHLFRGARLLFIADTKRVAGCATLPRNTAYEAQKEEEAEKEHAEGADEEEAGKEAGAEALAARRACSRSRLCLSRNI